MENFADIEDVKSCRHGFLRHELLKKTTKARS